MSSKVVLVTGANRGIGRGFIDHYLSQPNHTVIATVRDRAHPTALSLGDIPRAQGTQLITVDLDYAYEDAVLEAADFLRKEHNITHLDILVANAAINTSHTPAIDVISDEARIDYDINALGTLRLYQGLRPLLLAAAEHDRQKTEKDLAANNGDHATENSTNGINDTNGFATNTDARRDPIFVAISSRLGSAGAQDHPMMKNVKDVAYGMSKAAMNYCVKRMHVEDDWLCAFSLSPGLVATDMGNRGAGRTGMSKAPKLTIEESVGHMVKVIGNATKATRPGDLYHWDGSVMPF